MSLHASKDGGSEVGGLLFALRVERKRRRPEECGLVAPLSTGTPCGGGGCLVEKLPAPPGYGVLDWQRR